MTDDDLAATIATARTLSAWYWPALHDDVTLRMAAAVVALADQQRAWRATVDATLVDGPEPDSGTLPAPPHATAKNTRTPVASSNLRSIGYDAVTRVLTLEFHRGAVWSYSGVAYDTYQGLMQAESKGSYFAKHIKPHHAAARIDTPAKENVHS